MVPYQILIHSPDHFITNDTHSNRASNTHVANAFNEIASTRRNVFNDTIAAHILKRDFNETFGTEQEIANHSSIKLCAVIENQSVSEKLEECWERIDERNTTAPPILTSIPKTRWYNMPYFFQLHLTFQISKMCFVAVNSYFLFRFIESHWLDNRSCYWNCCCFGCCLIVLPLLLSE